MKLSEILEGVKSGSIALIDSGHRFSHTTVKEQLLGNYQKALDVIAGKHMAGWSSEPDVRTRNHFQSMLNTEFKSGDFIMGLDLVLGDIFDCTSCGTRYYFRFAGDSLCFDVFFDKSIGDFVIDTDTCKGAVRTPIVGRINVDSQLIFANFFSVDSEYLFPDQPDKDKCDSQYSLNSYLGRKNITEYKASNHNVAYGQMSNMSVGVFVHPSMTSIIIGDPYIFDARTEGMSDTEYEEAESRRDELETINGHKLVGQICLDVWRWEATDYNTIAKHYKALTKSNNQRGWVECAVAHGVWEFTHCFDWNVAEQKGHPEDIYSTFKLVEAS